jgi:hypothetical protein
MCLSSDGNVTAQKTEVGKEAWQVVKCKLLKSSTSPQVSETRRRQQRCSLYLKKMKGLCFNCETIGLHLAEVQQGVGNAANLGTHQKSAYKKVLDNLLSAALAIQKEFHHHHTLEVSLAL